MFFLVLATYEETNAENAKVLKDVLEVADIVLIHDPRPLALIHLRKKGFSQL